MEVQIKKTVKAGNSSAVVLPRAWLNQKVRVELVKKSHEEMLYDVLELVKKHIQLKEIVGIYLVGSYARGEESRESDIDILVMTDNIDKKMISEGIYNILLVSKNLLKQKLEKDLFPIGQMLKEAKPLLNADYIEQIAVKVTKKNVKWYLDTTEDKLKIIKKVISKKGKYADKRVIYTLILRIRTLHIIKKLVKNQTYSNKQFIKTIRGISGKDSYEEYLVVKNDLKNKEKISMEEAEKLYNYLKKELKEVKDLLKY